MTEKERVHRAACGMCRSVCGLFVKGICLPCGSGLPEDRDIVEKKMVEQIRNLGKICSKRQCVVDKGIGCCMKDCAEFPCGMYRGKAFPYSDGLLQMYESRNRKRPAAPRGPT